MKKSLTNLLFFLFLLHADTYGQTLRKCASNEVLLRQLQNDPAFSGNRRQIENFTLAYVERGGSGQQHIQRGTPLYTIPVIVHVMYNTSAQNISDAQIQSQLSVLNKDFQLNNTDASGVPAAFSALVADAKIQFCLAQQDPAGNATTGIIRKQTTVTSFFTNDNVKRSVNGGDNAWDASKYLNLWVCNISGGILGYAQFPGGAAATDGVVINYTAFGTTGTAAAPFNLGRTATHEVGHWLNLYHIWGDDGAACTGSDQVGDTPNQADENYGCPSFPAVSCSNGPNGDMFMNYMDYTDDRCMYMFSIGQRDRMYGVLQSGGARASLASSPGCSPPSTSGCSVPAGVSASSAGQNATVISWGPVSAATNYTLQYKTTSASAFTSVSVAATSYTITGLTPATSYNYQVRANCGGLSSNFSSLQTFITQSSGCTDSYEPNNTYASGFTIPANTSINGLISTATDKDYFKFSNSAVNRNMSILLSNLPADYDLRLYSPTGTLLKTSQKNGTTNETISYNTTVTGIYSVYVYGYDGAFNAANCYNLAVQTSGTSFREEERMANPKTFFSVSPIPASTVLNVAIHMIEADHAEITLTNQLGATIMRKKTYLIAGLNDEKFVVSQFSTGVYFLKVQSGKMVQTIKVYINR